MKPIQTTDRTPLSGDATPLGPMQDKSRKRKQRTSRELRSMQELEHGVAKATTRVSKAVAKGYATYLDRREQSAEQRRDGALRDGAKNVSRGIGRAMRQASRAPLDFAETFESKRMTKRVRKAVRAFMRPFSG